MLREDQYLFLESFGVSLTTALNELDCEARLKDAIHYSLFPAGKRIRPLLAYSLFADLGGNDESFVELTVPLEILHSASLIHDDLPSMDNDDFRRGRPSCHKVYGESTALLAADLMIAYASTLLSRAPYDSRLILLMIERLSISFCNLCRGQEIDVLSTQSAEEFITLCGLKTGALFRCATEIAALAHNLPAELVKLSGKCGEELGVIFQLVDDYLDYFGTETDRGRPESSDKRNQKRTLFSSSQPEIGHRALQEHQRLFTENVKNLSKNSKYTEFPRLQGILQNIIVKVPATQAASTPASNQ